MNTATRADLQATEMPTLAHYEQHAQAFWQGTKDHDVTQNYHAFLSAMPANTVLDILDFGCGPGRDLHYFKSLGHRTIGLDGCENFCRMAREYAGCEVLHQSFLQLTLPHQRFDGTFANASLFHVPSSELLRVLGDLRAALKPGGILFMSNPRGDGEGWNGDRYGHYMEFEKSEQYLTQAGFIVRNHYYRPEGKPRNEQPWLAIVSERT